MKNFKQIIKQLHTFLLLWSTQTFSSLGSSMTGFALILWSYEQHGSALLTSFLSICTYAPYVLLSIFAGTLSDKWNKKVTMLLCDGMAALTTIVVLYLLNTHQLQLWHLYVVNSVNGIMNALQQPASDVTITLLTPRELYQQVSSLRSFSDSLITVLVPVIASSLYAFLGLRAVIAFDLITFMTAWLTLIFLIQIPALESTKHEAAETFWQSTKQGLLFLKTHRGILDLILFLAMINLAASMYQAVLPALLLSRKGGGETVLGLVNACCGLANLAGSVYLLFSKPPKSRIAVICNTLLFSMMSENLILALGTEPWMWCLGAILGWICIPIMNTNLDVVLRSSIPAAIQGRVYSARNTLQFFTIPLGYFLGGYLVDWVFEPFMAAQSEGLLVQLFGSGKGSGAALLFLMIAILGIVTCLIFRHDRYIWQLEKTE